MIWTILIITLFVLGLGALGFAPAQSFSPTQRGFVGVLLVICFVLYLLKYSAFAH